MTLLHSQLFAVGPPAGCTHSFFGLPAWYAYIPSQDFGANCQITTFTFPNDLVYVGLAAVDIALTIAGAAAVIYVIWGGIQYVISQGEPDKTRAARNTITNALVGLVIASIAIAVVSYLGSQLGAG